MASTTFKAATAFFALLHLAAVGNASDIPSYCDPGKPYNSNSMYWSDQSQACADAGLADTCCVTFISGGICNSVSMSDPATVSDLESVVATQITQSPNHWYSGNSKGSWDASWLTLLDDQPDSNILTEWYHGISDFVENGNDFGAVGGVFFYAYANGLTTGVYVSPTC